MTTCGVTQGHSGTGHESASRFRLDELTPTQWAELDISTFLLEHVDRFCGKLYRRFPEFEAAELRSIFFEQALPRLRRMHARHLNAEGEDRNRLVGAAVREIVRQIVAGEGGMGSWYRHTSHCFAVDPHELEKPAEDSQASYHWYYCSEMSSPAPDALAEDPSAVLEHEHIRRVQRLERARGHLTTRQYEVLYQVMVEQTPTGELARGQDISPSAIGRVRRQARQRIEQAAREGRLKKG